MELDALPASSAQDRIMQPYPDVPQYQRDAHQQQTDPGVPRAGDDAPLVHLAVAGLDPVSLAIGLANPGRRDRPQTPVGKDARSNLALASPAGLGHTGHADVHRRLLLPVPHQMPGEAAPLPGQKTPRSFPLAQGTLAGSSPVRHGQEKRTVDALE